MLGGGHSIGLRPELNTLQAETGSKPVARQPPHASESTALETESFGRFPHLPAVHPERSERPRRAELGSVIRLLPYVGKDFLRYPKAAAGRSDSFGLPTGLNCKNTKGLVEKDEMCARLEVSGA
jgi:hypothetical protein